MTGEWRETTLDQIGRIVTGKTPPSSRPDYFGGDIPFVTPTDFDGRRIIDRTGRYLTENGANSVAARISTRAVMVSCIGSDMGKAAVSGRESVTNQQINSIIVADPNNPLFVYYNLSTRKEEIRGAAGGSAQPILNKSAFGRLAILLPPLAEQHAIAHILGTLDDKIELNRKQNETLEAMARALFKAWFVDFEPVRAKIEDRWQRGQSLPGLPAHLYDLFPDRLVESELGEIPEGWEVSKIEHVITRLPVGKKYDQKTVSSEGLIPVLDQGKSGVIGFHNDEPGVIATPQMPVVVFANHTCYMRLINFSFSAIQNVLPFIGKDLPTIWVYYATIGKQLFVEYKGHWPDFVIHEIAIPPLSLAEEFAKIVFSHLMQIWENERESRTLAQLRDTLLPKLISGELRIQDAEAFLKERGL